MKKILLTLGLFLVVVLGVSRVFAQTTEPGANLPLLPDETSSATQVAATATPYSALATVIATVDPYADTAITSATQSAVDDADTGSEVVFLAILSVTGGIGIFLIKKYFDFKRYSL